jgi:hypothetical protein
MQLIPRSSLFCEPSAGSKPAAAGDAIVHVAKKKTGSVYKY